MGNGNLIRGTFSWALAEMRHGGATLCSSSDPRVFKWIGGGYVGRGYSDQPWEPVRSWSEELVMAEDWRKPPPSKKLTIEQRVEQLELSMRLQVQMNEYLSAQG